MRPSTTSSNSSTATIASRMLLVVAPLLAVSNAFAPLQGASLIRPRSHVRNRPTTLISLEKDSVTTGGSVEEVPLDLSKSLFLDDSMTPLDQNNAGQDFDVVPDDAGLSQAVNSMVESSSAKEEAPVVSTLTLAIASAGLLEKENRADLEIVSAILAASGEAVAAAGASVSFNGSNGSETVAALEPTELFSSPTIVEKDEIMAPSVTKILKFAVPAIGVWLCGPLLSLIDTSTVGLLAGTAQQAALNPAVAVTDYAALLVAFLFTGTTNMVASAQATDKSLPGRPRTTKSLIGAIQLSAYVGVGLGAILFAFARPLLKAIIGNDGISPTVFAAAMKYVRIRALGMPAAAMIGSAQAACLGMQDIRSPLYVLAAAALVNFIGDMLFVGSSHPLIGGAAGAAWATVFSQMAAISLFIHWLCNKPRSQYEGVPAVNVSKAIMELTGKSSEGESRRERFCYTLRCFRTKMDTKCDEVSSEVQRVVRGGSRLTSILQRSKNAKTTTAADNEAKPKEESFSARGFLEGRFGGRDVIKFPSREIIKEFAPYVIPVTSTQVGRVSGYVAMSHVVSSSLGTTSMAAQQIIVSLFYCLCPIADSLSLTAQSFVPSISEKKISKERSKALRQTMTNFFKAGGVFGGVMLGAVAFIPFLSRFFTTDPVVVAMVNSVAPLLLGVFAVHGMVCAAEGLLLGQKDLSFLGRMYAGYFAIVPYFMLRVKRAAMSGASGINLTSVWKVFLSYQLFRFVAWVGRVTILQRRTERASAELMEGFE